MTIFDYYLLRRFLWIFLVCFLSLSGLFVIVHAFTNLEEIALLSKNEDSIRESLLNFYGPRVLNFFNQTCPLIALVAGIFTFTILEKSQEITVLEAAGANKYRIIRPVLIAVVILLGLVALNRELVIPNYRDQLVQSVQDQTGNKLRPIVYFQDPQTGIVIRSGQVQLADDTIRDPVIQLVSPRAEHRSPATSADPPQKPFEPLTIEAEIAEYAAANAHHPAGYLLGGIKEPGDFQELAQVDAGTQRMIFRSPRDQWLDEGECFLTLEVTPPQIASGPETAQYAPVTELIAANRRPSAHFSNRQRVEVHRRIMQPLLDLSLVLLGLPIVVCRGERNVFYAAGICMAVVITLMSSTMASHALGGIRIINPPALAAWLPILVFTPFAYATIQRLKAN